MKTNEIPKRFRRGLFQFRNRELPFGSLANRRPPAEVRRKILEKLSLRLNKKLASS